MGGSPLFSEVAVSLDELETAVSCLPDDELAAFARWFEDYLADAWDRRIEADIKAGRLDEAGRGVPFDEMAVCLRAPQQYLGLLEHACARGGVPAYFDRGTRRPDPSGRAFVALLSCAVDGLSAKRFDEYLSLGQVPPVDAARSARPPASTDSPPVLHRPADEVFHSAIDDAQSGFVRHGGALAQRRRNRGATGQRHA